MGRILLLLFIALLIYLVFKGLFKSASKPGEQAPSTSAKGEDMVTCSRCGVNLPRSDAAVVDDQLVCRDNPKCLEAKG